MHTNIPLKPVTIGLSCALLRPSNRFLILLDIIPAYWDTMRSRYLIAACFIAIGAAGRKATTVDLLKVVACWGAAESG
jgi:hypothetical protein